MVISSSPGMHVWKEGGVVVLGITLKVSSLIFWGENGLSGAIKYYMYDKNYLFRIIL